MHTHPVFRGTIIKCEELKFNYKELFLENSFGIFCHLPCRKNVHVSKTILTTNFAKKVTPFPLTAKTFFITSDHPIVTSYQRKTIYQWVHNQASGRYLLCTSYEVIIRNPSSIWWRGSNSRPLGRESSAVTTKHRRIGIILLAGIF